MERGEKAVLAVVLLGAVAGIYIFLGLSGSQPQASGDNVSTNKDVSYCRIAEEIITAGAQGNVEEIHGLRHKEVTIRTYNDSSVEQGMDTFYTEMYRAVDPATVTCLGVRDISNQTPALMEPPASDPNVTITAVKAVAVTYHQEERNYSELGMSTPEKNKTAALVFREAASGGYISDGLATERNYGHYAQQQVADSDIHSEPLRDYCSLVTDMVHAGIDDDRQRVIELRYGGVMEGAFSKPIKKSYADQWLRAFDAASKNTTTCLGVKDVSTTPYGQEAIGQTAGSAVITSVRIVGVRYILHDNPDNTFTDGFMVRQAETEQGEKGYYVGHGTVSDERMAEVFPSNYQE